MNVVGRTGFAHIHPRHKALKAAKKMRHALIGAKDHLAAHACQLGHEAREDQEAGRVGAHVGREFERGISAVKTLAEVMLEVLALADVDEPEPGELPAAMANRVAGACTGSWIALLQVGALPREGWLLALVDRSRGRDDLGAIAMPIHRDAAEAAIAVGEAQTVNLAGATSLAQLIALLGRSRLFVGCDTGPMHLAVAQGVPVLALFGPADPARTGPFGSRARVLREPPWKPEAPFSSAAMDALDVDRVLEGIRELDGQREVQTS